MLGAGLCWIQRQRNSGQFCQKEDEDPYYTKQEPFYRLAANTVRLNMDGDERRKWLEYCRKILSGLLKTKMLFRDYNHRRSDDCMIIGRNKLRVLVEILTE